MSADPHGGVGRSLSEKIAGLFGLTLLTALAVQVTIWFVFERGTEVDRFLARDLIASLSVPLVEELGSPPDSTAARQLANRLGVEIFIERPLYVWTSSAAVSGTDSSDLGEAVELEGYRLRVGLQELRMVVEFVRADWRVVLSFPTRAAELPSSVWDDLLAAVLVVLIFGASYLALRWLVSPLHALADGVRRIQEGTLDLDMQSDRTDELGLLITSFNAMATTVRERITARDRLLRDVSHEIRSPLARIRVAAEMTKEVEVRRSIASDVEEIDIMVGDLLETERLDSVHGGLNLTTVNLTSVLEECASNQAAFGPVHLVSDSVPLCVLGDRERLRAMFQNLMSNARKFSEPTAPIRVAAQLLHEDEEIVVTVADEGVGIDAEHLPFITEPFYQADAARSPGRGGYGLGLSLVKRVAEAHQGRIEIESQVGVGTTVMVRLPACGASSPAE